MEEGYYVDTCVYLNIWQKEVANSIELWKLAKEFFDKIEERGNIIYYSGFILKELMYILSEEEYYQKRELFNGSSNFIKATLNEAEYEEARKIEMDLKGKIGFYDIMHMLLARKTHSVLITRDKKLIETSNKFNVKVKRPEEVL